MLPLNSPLNSFQQGSLQSQSCSWSFTIGTQIRDNLRAKKALKNSRFYSGKARAHRVRDKRWERSYEFTTREESSAGAENESAICWRARKNSGRDTFVDFIYDWM